MSDEHEPTTETDLTPEPKNNELPEHIDPPGPEYPPSPEVTSIEYTHDGPATITHASVTVEFFYDGMKRTVTLVFRVHPGRAEFSRVDGQKNLSTTLRALPDAKEAVANIPGVEEVVGIEGLIEKAEEYVANCETYNSEDESLDGHDGEEADADA